ncbi:hypothetical protein M406DRAFT_339457 [Cryphonectria parasitica EP155]|uniref:Zn(2)-C6 fungal-type domain-containing protein n=1 Tax=Cryphonectria parasitica (strain ATCC 38755 / EP155) TaxID=660469 RepID=A0A9P5CP74_CRYP1|nr:uncharacterized protein M406DRAFT_339457 [Cryphonectria parasitica EP155]KAF3766189.1 hypothetical protein M406DRAFT_339457 [Cryphonectria parasitica EP155]
MATLSGGALPPPKQIRFVNNQGQPPSKRRRVNAACLTCRKRKTRCDGEKPICSACEKNGHQCLGYPDVPEKTTKQESTNNSGKPGPGKVKYEVAVDSDDGGLEEMVKTEEKAHQRKQDGGRKPSTSGRQQSDTASTSSGPTPRTKKESHEWEGESSASQTPGRSAAKRFSSHRTVSFSEDGRSSNNRSPVPHRHDSHRVPYFRYFGPTAIVPGLKQMVVNVGPYSRRRSSRGSMSATSPLSLFSHRSAPSHADTVLEPFDDLPVYDPNDHAPVPPLITGLVEIFFLHLGCIHPFLRGEKIIRLVKEKKVDSILVDAMCALAARFANFDKLPGAAEGSRAEYGHVFAQRAKAATVDTFPCPTVGAVQAYLLLAYEGFGANQDSALWMYLGLAIRMAFDMGLQKNEGVQYQGDKDPWYTGSWNRLSNDEEDEGSPVAEDEKLSPQEQQEIVQERIDTAWAVYILDRVISTGTGRTVTVRDDEFELPIPEPAVDLSTGLPAPYPLFAHIIQLYGRASDVLNKLRKVSDLTGEKLAMLAKIERDLIGVYEKQDPRLQFNPLHFSNYAKNGQGTLFILLHVWFHACIIILHQPLLTPFGSRDHQLTAGSRELAMSSAKSIADMLALAEVIDPNSYRTSPFTSQPMYIAACAFLTELAAQSSLPASRATSPTPGRQNGGSASGTDAAGMKVKCTTEAPSKHSLLAEKSNENYRRCYKSLQQLQDHWGGVKYILNALDHRSKGVWDCETYTAEEYASTKLARRPASLAAFPRSDTPASPPPNIDLMAWSLTGTTNTSNSTLVRLYQNVNKNGGPSQTSQFPPLQPPAPPPVSAPTPPGNWRFDPVRQSLPESTAPLTPAIPQPVVSAVRYSMGPSPQATSSARGATKFEAVYSAEATPGTPGSENRLQPFTPSSNYEPSVLQGASPSSSLAEPNPSSSSSSHQQRANANHSSVAAAEMINHYGHEFAQNGMASGSFSYMGGSGSIADAIMVEQVDLGSMQLPTDMFAPWDLFPGANFADVFDASGMGGDTEGQGQI